MATRVSNSLGNFAVSSNYDLFDGKWYTSFSLVVEKWKGQVSREHTSDKQRWSSGIIFDILRVETRNMVIWPDRGNGIRMIGAKTTRL